MWNEADSATFVQFARAFVPDRERQIEIICDLLPDPRLVVDLCCGEGLLSEAVLCRFPGCQVIGYDGSESMLSRARERNPERFEARLFELADGFEDRPDAVVSSLAIHHLDERGKRELYSRVFTQLAAGGTLVVADVIEPASAAAHAIAARDWDRAIAPEYRAAFEREQWNLFRYPDPETDKPSRLLEQLSWLREIGFAEIDVVYLRAGHAIFTGRRVT